MSKIQDAIDDFVRDMKANTPKKSGRLADSITGSVNERGNIIIEALGYIDFVNKGVNGTKVNHGSIFSYSDKMPPISAFADAENPWAVAKSIQQKGITPSLFIEKTFDESFSKLADSVAEEVADKEFQKLVSKLDSNFNTNKK